MAVTDKIGTRMKEFYETIPKARLMRRCPVICRIDGKAFHSYTKKFQKPFDGILIDTMQKTMQYLCENIQGCVLGYTQSDEISLLLIDYKRFDSSAWFDNEVQKMCSISASMATMAFNKFFRENVTQWIDDHMIAWNRIEEDDRYFKALEQAIDKGAMFDSRVFNIPREEVTNYFYWRQLDAIRNSIEMVGQANFSHKELHKKTCTMIKDMLKDQRNIDWDKLPISLQRGTGCYKDYYWIDKDGKTYSEYAPELSTRSQWVIDKNIPIFVNEGRSYIDRFIDAEEI